MSMISPAVMVSLALKNDTCTNQEVWIQQSPKGQRISSTLKVDEVIDRIMVDCMGNFVIELCSKGVYYIMTYVPTFPSPWITVGIPNL